MKELNAFPAYSAAELEQTFQGIANELWAKFANNTSVVPYAWYITDEHGNKRKQFSPLRRNCKNCPPKGTVEISHRSAPDKPKFLKNWNLCAYNTGRNAAHQAAAANPQLPLSEFNAIWQRVEKEALTAHNYPHSPEFMYWHVVGRFGHKGSPRDWFVDWRAKEGDEFYCGYYSHDQNGEGRCTSADHDKHEAAVRQGGTTQERMLAVQAVFDDVGLGAFVFNNKSFGEGGRHNHLLHEPIASPLRYALITTAVEKAGLIPGTQPDQGQTECFPKQPDADGKYGNLIGTPVCYSRILQHNGATAPLDPRTGYAEVITDPRAVLTFLQQHPVATKAEIYSACKKLGIDPENLPAPKKRRSAGKRKVQVQGRRYVYDDSKLDELDREILKQITVVGLISSECGKNGADNGTDHYLCPIHNETENTRSFHVFVHSALGVEWWKCHGDCNYPGHCSTGDAIQFYAQLKRISRQEARGELARRIGLDPGQFRPTFMPDPDEGDADETADLSADKSDSSADKSDAGADEAGGEGAPDRFQAALEDHLDKKTASLTPYPERQGNHRRVVRSAFRELAAAILQVKPLIEAKHVRATTYVWGMSRIFLKHGLAPELIVEILSPLLPFKGWHQTKDDLLAEVGNVADRLARGQGVVKPWTLRKKLRYSYLSMLAAALFRFAYDVDHPTGFLETMKEEIGFERHVKGAYRFLRNLAAKERAKLKPENPDKVDKEQERIRRTVNQIMNMTSCGRYENEVVSNSDGKTIAHRPLCCNGKGCPRCFLDFAWREEKLALEEYQKLAKSGKEFHTHMVIGIPLELTFHMKSEIAKHCKYAKLCAVGFVDGKGVLFIVSYEDYVLARIEAICGRVYGEWKRRTGSLDAPRLTHAQRKDTVPQVVVQMVSNVKMLYHLELLNRIWAKDEEAVLEFLRATYDRRSLTRSVKGPYWPSAKEVKAMVKAENDDETADFMAEELSYLARFRPTGELLAQRDKRPFTLKEVLALVHASPFRRAVHDAIGEICDGSEGSIKANQAEIEHIAAEHLAMYESANLTVADPPGLATDPPERPHEQEVRDNERPIGAPTMLALAPGYVKVEQTHAAATAEYEYDDDGSWHELNDEAEFEEYDRERDESDDPG